jgi:hypothetical protein
VTSGSSATSRTVKQRSGGLSLVIIHSFLEFKSTQELAAAQSGFEALDRPSLGGNLIVAPGSSDCGGSRG